MPEEGTLLPFLHQQGIVAGRRAHQQRHVRQCLGVGSQPGTQEVGAAPLGRVVRQGFRHLTAVRPLLHAEFMVDIAQHHVQHGTVGRVFLDCNPFHQPTHVRTGTVGTDGTAFLCCREEGFNHVGEIAVALGTAIDFVRKPDDGCGQLCFLHGFHFFPLTGVILCHQRNHPAEGCEQQHAFQQHSFHILLFKFTQVSVTKRHDTL